jgi:hypothetical protein
MSRTSATITVDCDRCGESLDEMPLTPLAGGGWDDRNVKRTLESYGWRVTKDADICDNCVADESEQADDAVAGELKDSTD